MPSTSCSTCVTDWPGFLLFLPGARKNSVCIRVKSSEGNFFSRPARVVAAQKLKEEKIIQTHEIYSYCPLYININSCVCNYSSFLENNAIECPALFSSLFNRRFSGSDPDTSVLGSLVGHLFIRVSRLSTDRVSSLFRACVDNIYIYIIELLHRISEFNNRTLEAPFPLKYKVRLLNSKI